MFVGVVVENFQRTHALQLQEEEAKRLTKPPTSVNIAAKSKKTSYSALVIKFFKLSFAFRRYK